MRNNLCGRQQVMFCLTHHPCSPDHGTDSDSHDCVLMLNNVGKLNNYLCNPIHHYICERTNQQPSATTMTTTMMELTITTTMKATARPFATAPPCPNILNQTDQGCLYEKQSCQVDGNLTS